MTFGLLLRRRSIIFDLTVFVIIWPFIGQLSVLSQDPSSRGKEFEMGSRNNTTSAEGSGPRNNLSDDEKSQLKNASKTLSRLVFNYDNRLRPKFGGDAVVVEIELIIASFDRISEVNMDYTMTILLNQYWNDERLVLSEEMNQSRPLTLSGEFSQKIWVPDTFFANDKHSFLHDVTEDNKMIRLYPNGTVFYGMRFTTTLACMMDLTYYPMDEQNCTIEIESYGYPTEDLNMIWRRRSNAVSLLEDVEMPQFTLTKHRFVEKNVGLSTGSYKRLSLSFALRRNIGFFVFQTYLPSTLIVMLSWVSFWINHEATSARVALGITTVLTMTTISTGVRSNLPRISYVKAIDVYLVMCFAFVFSALLEYAAVNYSYWGNRSKNKIRKSLKRCQKSDNSKVVNIESSREGSPIACLRKRFTQKPHMKDASIQLKTLSSSADKYRKKDDNSVVYSVLSDRVFHDDCDDSVRETSSDFSDIPSVSLVTNDTRKISHNDENLSCYTELERPTTPPESTLASNAGPNAKTKINKFPPRKANNNHLRRQSNAKMKRCLPRAKKMLEIQDVNKIDKFSRILFPLLFVLFNICYWSALCLRFKEPKTIDFEVV